MPNLTAAEESQASNETASNETTSNETASNATDCGVILQSASCDLGEICYDLNSLKLDIDSFMTQASDDYLV